MLEGEISQINLIERLVELWREQFTGAIRFENDGIIKIIYFKGGDILSASTNDRSDSIDEILMRAGKVSREHVKQALARRKESETLGDAMLNLGYITRKELTWARRVQVVGVIRSINNWTNGSFTIVNDYLPKRDEGTLFPLPQVLVELIVTEQDRSAIEKALGGGAAVFSKAPDFEDVFRRLGLNEDAEAIVAQVNGTRTAAEVASASGRDAFNVYKLLHAFATLGILTQAGKPQVTPEFSLGDDAVADAADLWTTESSAPQFELDEVEAAGQPTLEVPGMSMEEERTAISPLPARSAWDVDEEELAEPSVSAAKLPAWDAPPATVAVPIPAPVEPPAERAEEQWGFDEAQIDAVKRASRPATRSAPAFAAGKPARPVKGRTTGKRTGLLVAILLIVLLAGAGYAGFVWWQKQQDVPAPTVAAARPATRPAAAQPAPAATDTSMTIVDATPTGTATTATSAAVTTTAPTVANATAASEPAPTTTTATTRPAPLTVTSTAPVPAAPSTSAKPTAAPVSAPSADQGRVAELARRYAANPKGNFTVQIQILCNAANVEKAMKDGGANVWFVPQTLGARSCYRVFWGNFATREEAQRAMASVPASLRDPTAAVKPVPKPLP